jgi:hypothetical protein
MPPSSAAITTWWIYCISYLMALSLNTASASSAAHRLPQATITTPKAEQGGLGTMTPGLEGRAVIAIGASHSREAGRQTRGRLPIRPQERETTQTRESLDYVPMTNDSGFRAN